MAKEQKKQEEKKETEKKQEEKKSEERVDGGQKAAEAGKMNFLQFLYGLSVQAQIALGMIANPMTQKYERDLDIARYHIDILEMLQEKTQGNLNTDEQSYLKQILTDLRMRYVFEHKEREKAKEGDKDSSSGKSGGRIITP